MSLDRKTLQRFCKTELQPRLAEDFEIYKSTMIRTVNCFAQMIVLSGGRFGETLKVMPTFYVFGARPWENVVPQSVALDTESPNRWRFVRPLLDSSLADSIAKLLLKTSPLSFKDVIDSHDVVATLEKCSRLAGMESAALFLGFYSLATGRPSAYRWLESARASFLKQNNDIRHEWQLKTIVRIDELLARASDPCAKGLSRAEANQHASSLGVRPLAWFDE